MALSEGDIRFVDTYLKNSDIRYADVRAEMTDHIGEAVSDRMEREKKSFYEAFKAYMVDHKKDLLANYKSFQKDLDIQNIRRVTTLMLKPYSLILFTLSLFLYTFFSTSDRSYHLWLYSIGIIFFGLLLFSAILYLRIGSERYSSLDRMALFMVFFQQFALMLLHFVRPGFFLSKFSLLVGFLFAFYVCLSLAYALRFFELYVNYRVRIRFHLE